MTEEQSDQGTSSGSRRDERSRVDVGDADDVDSAPGLTGGYGADDELDEAGAESS